MAMQRQAVHRSLDLTTGLYFGERYRPERIEEVLRAIHPVLQSRRIQCFFEDLQPANVTFARISEITRWGGTAVEVDPDDTVFRTLIGTKLVERIQGVHGRTGRDVTIRPWIDTDDTAVVEVSIALFDREERATVSRIVEVTWQEAPLLNILDNVDPLWGNLELAGPTPTIGSITKGGNTLPYCGYWGTKLVSIIGRDRLEPSLRGCPKVVRCPRGGYFLCWDWDGGQALRTQRFEEFRALVRAAAGLLSRA